MSTISVRLAESLHRRVKEIAKQEGISINQFITSALTEKMSAFMTEEYLAERAKRASRQKYDQALSKVRDVEPEPDDSL